MMRRILLYTGMITLAVVLAVVAWPEGPRPDAERFRTDAPVNPSAASAPASETRQPALATGSEIVDLRRQLDQESRARGALEARLSALEREIAGLRAVLPDATSPDSAGVASGEVETDENEGSRRAWFDEQALVASGMDEASARELRLFFEQLELERLRLRDRATREDWESARTRDEFAALGDREVALRERLGDEGYAAYLYAAGRSNRVEVTSVLASAPAGQAGIQAGDQILRYADERIYSPRELRRAISDGDIGDLVEVEVERDGESLRFYLSRGPLGVRTGSLSVAP